MNEIAGNSNANHQSIIQFKGQWYFIYHNGALADAGGFRRSVCIDRLCYILVYDVYTKGRYQFTKTTDLKTFAVVDQKVTMNFHPCHSTIISITREEAKCLAEKWL